MQDTSTLDWLCDFGLRVVVNRRDRREFLEEIGRTLDLHHPDLLDRAARDVETSGTARHVRLGRQDVVFRIHEGRLTAIIRRLDEDAVAVVHELGNALTAISGWATVIDQGPEEHCQEALFNLQEAALSALDVSSRLLLSLKNADNEPACANLAEEVERAERALLPLALAAGVQIESSIPRELWIAMAPVEIHSVLSNLLKNAIEALGEAGTVTLTAQSGENEITLFVADNGAGIAPQVRDTIFSFGRSGRANGHGIGLNVVARLVERRAGRIEVQSDASGTEFALRLPRALRTHAEARRSSTIRMKSPMRVLAIDDDDHVRNMLEMVLQLRGMDVTACATAEAAFAAARVQRFDAVLLDLHLSYECSRAVLHRLRREQPHVRIIVCSGDPSAPELGGDDFLRKPFAPDEVERILRQPHDRFRLESVG